MFGAGDGTQDLESSASAFLLTPMSIFLKYSLLLLIYLFVYFYVYVCLHVLHMCVVPKEARREHLIPCNCQVCGKSNPGSLQELVSALSHQAISHLSGPIVFSLPVFTLGLKQLRLPLNS